LVPEKVLDEEIKRCQETIKSVSAEIAREPEAMVELMKACLAQRFEVSPAVIARRLRSRGKA
jgi:hypothetical protein